MKGWQKLEKRYKFTLFNNNVYKEIELPPDLQRVRIGTEVGCDIRLHRYFDDFEMVLEQQNGNWSITASDGIYFSFNKNKKVSLDLTHGNVFFVKYEQYAVDLFVCRFLLDFDYEQKDYKLAINISKSNRVVISSNPKSNIVINSPYILNDTVTLQKNGDRFVITSEQSQYGVLHNGKPLVGETTLCDYDFLSIADFSFYFKNGILFTTNSGNIKINGLSSTTLADDSLTLNYPLFNRSSRLKIKLNEEEIKLLSPNDKPKKPKSNMMLKLLPTLSMIALTIAIRGFMNGSNMSFMLYSVCSMGVGAAVSVFTIKNEKKEYAEEIEKREQDYTAYIEQKRVEIGEARKDEETTLNQIYYPYSVTSSFVRNFSGNLYDRSPEDDDYLDVRIGTGSIKAIRKIDYKLQETYESADDDLVDLPVQLSEEFQDVNSAPIIVHLKEANVVGIVGEKQFQYEMLKIILFDVCVRQYFHDTNVFLFVKNDEIEKYEWTKWIRHLRNDETGLRNIICDDESKTYIFEYLYAEFNKRENSKEKTHSPHIVILVTHDYGIQQHPLSKYIKNASELGGTFIFFENSKEYIPVGCSQLLMLENGTTGHLVQTSDRSEITKFQYSSIPDAEIKELVQKMAPVYCEEISLEGALTKNITLYQLLGIISVEDIDLRTRWLSSDVTKSMAAPIGVRSGNEIVYLNIHDDEKAHGPHGLVAGTTGSGKSEVLMTYILSMATLYSPYEVAFLIIDFKGGGMGNQFKTLPHTLGVITDIDGKEINRSLISIKAEIERRKKLFAEADVDHINKYIKAWKAKKVKMPLPHLIIIVDEFAELKAQYGEFMSELNSAARVGRSLGVHLILATQKPQGQVDPQIDSNSKFRLCLKVQTPEDSREVIKTPLAAEIREAGRAYLMVGNNEVFELFQSAYSGASSKVDVGSNQKEFVISSVDFAGRRTPVFERKAQKTTDNEETLSQKDAITKWITDFFKANNLHKLADICQPPLPKLLEYERHKRQDDVGVYADLGIFDDPAQQRQESYTVNVAIQHMLIIGALQTGKTNVLQLIIRNLSEKYSPDEVNFYIIDYSSMILTNFQNLAHVGGVVLPNEDEKLNNLFKLLTTEITTRKQKLKGIGVSSYTAYKESGRNDMPLILLLIDNFTSLKELNLNDSPILLSILREGLSVGISVIVANGSVKGMEHKYLSSFACRIGLHHNNSDEYGTLFSVYKASVDAIPGRCLVSIDRKNLECQIYQGFSGEKEIEKVEMMKDFIQKINSCYPGYKATTIPIIPESLFENDVNMEFKSYYVPYKIILGFDYDTLQPMQINLCGLNVIMSGIPKSGKTNFVKYLISCIQKQIYVAPTRVAIFDKATIKSLENTAKLYSCVESYNLSPLNMGTLCKEWKAELEARKQLVLNNNGDLSVLDDKPLLLMICEDSSKEMLSGFDEKLFEYLDYKFAWIASNAENDEISATKNIKLYRAKASGAACMLFGSYAASKMFDGFINIGLDERRERLGVETSAGDVFYVTSDNRTVVYRLKTIIHQNQNNLQGGD